MLFFFICIYVWSLQGSRPLVYVYAQKGREINVFQAGAATEAGQKEKQNIFTVKKAIVAAAIHPHDPNILYVLHEDHTLSANSLNLAQHSWTELWHKTLSLDVPALSEVHSLGCSVNQERSLECSLITQAVSCESAK